MAGKNKGRAPQPLAVPEVQCKVCEGTKYVAVLRIGPLLVCKCSNCGNHFLKRG